MKISIILFIISFNQFLDTRLYGSRWSKFWLIYLIRLICSNTLKMSQIRTVFQNNRRLTHNLSYLIVLQPFLNITFFQTHNRVHKRVHEYETRVQVLGSQYCLLRHSTDWTQMRMKFHIGRVRKYINTSHKLLN